MEVEVEEEVAGVVEEVAEGGGGGGGGGGRRGGGGGHRRWRSRRWRSPEVEVEVEVERRCGGEERIGEEKGRGGVEEKGRGGVEERRSGGEKGGWRDSKFGIPPNNSVAHGLDMRHKIVFFFEFF